jgi:hypothetical protein
MVCRDAKIKIASMFVVCMVLLIAPAQARSMKRGLAYGHNTPADLAAIAAGVSWWYNWAIIPEDSAANVYRGDSMEFVPMAWSADFSAAKLRAFLKTHPDVKYILGFNEPNFKSQADMTPSAAAAAWPALEAIADEFNLKIVGPAVNYCGDCVSEKGTTYTDPIAYLDDFFAACPTCRVDYIAVHNYMCYQSALKSYLGKFYKYRKKIWLTEFACWDQPASVVTSQFQIDYMRSALSALETDTMVFRYAWFIGRTDNINAYPYQSIFAAAPGTLTDLGRRYVDFSANAGAEALTDRALKPRLRTGFRPQSGSFTLETCRLTAGTAPVMRVVDCSGRTVQSRVTADNGFVTVHLNSPTGVTPGIYFVSMALPFRSFALAVVVQ